MVSLTDLANSVLEKTREGKLSWTELDLGSYVATIGENAIIIDRNGPHLYSMRIVNSQGTELDRIPKGNEALIRDNEILEQIYEMARRQALRIEETLLNIKRSLDLL